MFRKRILNSSGSNLDSAYIDNNIFTEKYETRVKPVGKNKFRILNITASEKVKIIKSYREEPLLDI